MRRLSLAAGLLLVCATAFSPAGAAAKTYHVMYGTVDLGTWSTLAVEKTKKGTYNPPAFDSETGPGYPTVSLTRPLTAANRLSLFPSPPASGEKTVVSTAGKGAATCATSFVANYGSTGDPGSGTQVITFACVAVTKGKT